MKKILICTVGTEIEEATNNGSTVIKNVDSTNVDTPLLCFLLNSAQFHYEFCDEGEFGVGFKPQDHPKRSEILEKISPFIVEKEALLKFIIHPFRDDLNWYSTYPQNRISLITNYDWSNISQEIPSFCSIGSSIIQILESYEIFGEGKELSQDRLEMEYSNFNNKSKKKSIPLNHFRARDCLNDFCGQKEEKIRRIKSGNLCSECTAIWKEKLDSEQIDSLFEMMEIIRSRAVINQSHIRVKSRCRDLVSNIELSLHKLIEGALKELYLKDDWWVKGVKIGIRKVCAERFEERSCLGEKFQYTNLLDLHNIWNSHFDVFSKKEPFNRWENKEKLTKDYLQLNEIRNMLMHSPREYIPTNNDVQFLENIGRKVFYKNG